MYGMTIQTEFGVLRVSSFGGFLSSLLRLFWLFLTSKGFNIGQSEIYSLLVSCKSMELIFNVYVQAGENDRNPTGRAGTDPAP